MRRTAVTRSTRMGVGMGGAYGDGPHEEVDRDPAVDRAQAGTEGQAGGPGDADVGDEQGDGPTLEPLAEDVAELGVQPPKVRAAHPFAVRGVGDDPARRLAGWGDGRQRRRGEP